MSGATDVDIISFLLERRQPLTVNGPRECFDALTQLDATFANSTDRAAAGGASVDRLAWAFLAGYRAALNALDPTLGRACLCATEEGGAHPKNIHTRIVPKNAAFLLNGKKTFATLASAAETLLVVVSEGMDGPRNHLRVVRIPAQREGITIRDRPPLPFAPEIPHAEVTFDDVRVEATELLEGDGYARVLKPFRTIEDVHVSAAWLGYVTVHTRKRELVERALPLIVALGEAAKRDASLPETHILLAGILAHASALAADFDGDALWARDRPLLEVAGTARKLRLEAAWNRLSRPVVPA
jgi:acyl-CoA dehydrogenase